MTYGEEERSESVDALIRFYEMFEADRARGDVWGLMHYVGLFPGHEESVGREYFRLIELGRKEHARSAGSNLLASRYRLDRLLGKGGQGEVWLALDTNLGRLVALKLGGPSFGASSERSRLEREARIAASVEDPRICRILSVDAADGHSYIVMEYVPGKTLAESFAAREAPFGSSDPVDVRRVATLFREIATAIGIAHARGIIHRDVKPNNLMVKADGNPVVLDFGLARDDDDRERLTRTGDVIGTPGYMSPEQIDGKNGVVGPHSDVFALGVVFCEALSLRHPFEAANDIERRARVLGGDSVAVRHLAPWVPVQLATIVETAFEHDPNRRYPDANRMVADLTAFLENRPISARPVSPLRRAAMFARRNRTRIAWAGAALVIVALTLAFVAASRRGEVERGRRHLEELGVRLDRVENDYHELWPRDDAAIRAMEQWCDEVARMRGELPRLRERCQSLREAALPTTPDVERSRRAAIEASIEQCRAESSELDERLEKFAAWDSTDDRPFSPPARIRADQERLRHRIEALERDRAAPRVAWRCADEDSTAEHEAICDRIARIEALDWAGSTDASFVAMSRRLSWSRELSTRRTGVDGDRWASVIAAIRDVQANPKYHGLEIVPQFGLMPLGRNEQSGCFEFAHLASGVALDPLDADLQRLLRTDGDRARPWSVGIVFVLVPGGEFEMGQERDDSPSFRKLDWDADESPRHRVELDPFFIAKHELAQEQWIALSGRNDSTFEIDEPTPPDGMIASYGLPVETLRFDDAQTVLVRFGLDLPTEAQWEYAARGGEVGSWFAFGSNEKKRGFEDNFADRSFYVARNMTAELETTLHVDSFAFTAPIHAGSRYANGFGLLNVGGNVFEMCRDAYRPYIVRIVDREGLRVAPGEDVVIRGGSFSKSASACRVANREFMLREQVAEDVGIRPVLRLAR